MVVSQLRLRIYEILRPLFIDQSDNLDDKPMTKETLRREHDSIFINPLNGGYLRDNEYYDIELSKTPEEESEVCDFCQKKHSGNCLLDFKNKDYTIDQIM